MNNTTEDKHSENLLYVGFDVHKEKTSVALAPEGRDEEVEFYGEISSDLHAVEKFFSRLCRQRDLNKAQLRVVYEAGPCGFVLYRRCVQLGVHCQVIAPSKTPRKSGDCGRKTSLSGANERRLPAVHSTRWFGGSIAGRVRHNAAI